MWVGAALQLGMFDHLGEHGPCTFAEIESSVRLDHHRVTALALGLASVGLVEMTGPNLVGLTSSGRRLWRGHDRSLAHFARFVHLVLRPGWVATYERGDVPESRDIAATALEQGHIELFCRAMHESAREWFVDTALIDELAVPDRGHVVDLGGAPGTIVAALLSRHAQLRATVVDRPECLEASEFVLSRLDPDRVAVSPGDLTAPGVIEALGPPIDAMLLCRVAGALDDDQLRHLLTRCHRVLEPGGTVSILDAIVPDSDLSPAGQAAWAQLHPFGVRVRTDTEVVAVGSAAGLTPRSETHVRHDRAWNVVILEAS